MGNGKELDPWEIVRKHRDRWVQKFVDATHSDDVDEMKATARVVVALTECYWDVYHRKVE